MGQVRLKLYHFHVEWEEDFFFDIDIFKVRLCHLPVDHRNIKMGNVKRHILTIHGKYDTKFLRKSVLRKRKGKYQLFFTMAKKCT